MFKSFLGKSPKWFKATMVFFLVFNVFSYFIIGKEITSWLIMGEFIFTLVMALKCYPLQSGGLLALEILILGLTTPESAQKVVIQNFDVIFLLMFMVAGIFFMRPLLMYVFSKIFIKVKSKLILSLLFLGMAALLSAFLDALTVTAVLISVAVGFYGVYHEIQSSDKDYTLNGILDRDELSGESLEDFRAFLRSLIMHGVVGTALGGVCTLIGEPQNLLIGEKLHMNFVEFFIHMAPVSMPVLVCGILTAILLETTGWFGFGQKLPRPVRIIIESYTKEQDKKRTKSEKIGLIVQAIAAVFLVVGLAFSLAPVGFIGLGIIVLQTAFMGITKEHQIGEAFEEALPFTALIVVFFVVVAMIHDQKLFNPIIDWALSQPVDSQAPMFYVANGLLSMVSDNVFVATVYIGEVKQAFDAGAITQEQFGNLAIAINAGTNLPSVATPNGQAAFLFLLTSPLAPLIDLSYGKMVKMALPYTIVLSIVGFLAVLFFI